MIWAFVAIQDCCTDKDDIQDCCTDKDGIQDCCTDKDRHFPLCEVEYTERLPLCVSYEATKRVS